MAAVLTLQIIDEETGTEGDIEKEFRGQGLANILGGAFLSSQGGCAMIVPSKLNLASGGTGRLSGKLYIKS